MLVLGCDHGDRIEGVERITSTLEEGVVTAKQDVDTLRAAIEAERKRADEAVKDRKALQERVDALELSLKTLEEKVDELEVPRPTAPTVRPGRPDPAERYRVPVSGSAFTGPGDAKVTLVMFTDFQCPFCKRASRTMVDLQKIYGDDLRFVLKHNPLPMHRKAKPAALAFEAARKQGKEWKLHDLMYANSRELSDEDIERWAKDAGCNLRQFRSDLGIASAVRRVDDDQALATRVGARGTPAFFINGRYMSGAQPEAAFRKLIDEELKEAERRLGSGSSKASLYNDLMRDAKQSL